MAVPTMISMLVVVIYNMSPEVLSAEVLLPDLVFQMWFVIHLHPTLRLKPVSLAAEQLWEPE